MASLLTVDTLLTVHVAISLAGIATGLVAMAALARGHWLSGWQVAFLVTTVLTSVTGFLFPFSGVTPAFGFGVLSMAALAVAVGAAATGRRTLYAATATFALYLNLFVLVVQSFQKVEALNRIAPTQSETGFVVAQLAVLALALAIGFLAARASRRPALPA